MGRGITFVAWLALSCSALAGTYYFRLDGDDGNDGSSWDAAKKDVQGFVLSQTGGGNTIYVGPGTWQFTNEPMKVAKNTQIIGSNRTETIFRAAPTSSVIWTTGTNVTYSSFTATGGSNLVIIYAGGINGYSDTPPLTLVSNCTVVSNYYAGIGAASGTRFCHIVDSEVSYNRTKGGSYSVSGAHNSHFIGNVGGGLSVGPAGGVTNCEFSWNTAGPAINSGSNVISCTISNNEAGAYKSKLVSNCIAVGNSSYGYNCCGLLVDCIASNNTGWGVYRCPARNCLIVDNVSASYGGAELGGGVGITNCTIRGNSFYGSRYGKPVNCLYAGNGGASGYSAEGFEALIACTILGQTNANSPAQSVTNSVVANCLFWSNTVNAISNMVTASNSFDDPLFLQGTYVPTSTTAVDCGSATYTYTTIDFRGSNRVSGSAVDIGAFELQSGEVPVTERKKMFWGLLGGAQ